MQQRSQYFDPATRWINAHDSRHGHGIPAGTLQFQPQSNEDSFLMDDFDRALLAEPVEHNQQVVPDAMPKVLVRRTAMPIQHDMISGHAVQGDLYHIIPPHLSSSSPAFPVSSPTITAMQKRQNKLGRMPGCGAAEQPHTPRQVTETTPGQGSVTTKGPASSFQLGHAPPVIQGIQLVGTSRLPDQFRSLFKFSLFNAVQSKCFVYAFEGDDNIVLSAPTGSGKTAVMELTICRLLLHKQNEDFKVVYQAPTKSLCSERYRDWSAKFRSLGLQCAELTGDVESANLKNVQQANVIIATPEKWDSVTRKWKDNARLMRMIKLFLVDEVHILKEVRGATLEAVVSRMKSVGTGVRFVALSATVPNSEDIATWLGLNPSSQHLPAIREVFGESFRPTELEKHVIGYQSPPNDFILDNLLVKEVPSIIARYSKRKPVMIFCPTQKSAAKLAKSLAELWLASSESARLWPAPAVDIKVIEPELQKITGTAVAFHHGGLDAADRQAVEGGFLNGNINIICSTSTLAVGVNLPCYLVILKGTSCYTDSGLQEYSILETMQMLGRAGRPQFETSACAVIMTSKDKVPRYEKLIAGQDVLESSLHENLIEHLNAEIVVGTINDLPSARRWLRSTFLHVRVGRNPKYYKLDNLLEDDADAEILDALCKNHLQILEIAKLIETAPTYRCTDIGQAMSRYYVKFETIKHMVALPPKARQFEILHALTQAAEFKELRWKAGEKGLYKKMNKSTEVRYPVKVDIALPSHKASLIIQVALGGYMLDKDDASKFNLQLQQDTRLVLSHSNRLIRCMIDVQLAMKDATAAKNALELGRSLAAKVWDDTPMQLKQIEGVGDVTARKFASHGITNIEALSSTEAHKIELILGRNPPFGTNLLSRVHRFPSLLVTMKQTKRKRTKDGEVEVSLRCEIGSLVGKVATYFNQKPVYVCFLCETGYGKLIDFRRFSATRLTQASDFIITARLDRKTPKLVCHVMCDEIAGTHRYAEVKPDIPENWLTSSHEPQSRYGPGYGSLKNSSSTMQNDDFDDVDVVDEDFLVAEITSKARTHDIKNVEDIVHAQKSYDEDCPLPKRKAVDSDASDEAHQWREPTRLPNGNWTCQHNCTDGKKLCKHSCCKEGVKKPKKRPKLDTASTGLKTIHSATNKSHGKTRTRSIDDILATLPKRQRKEKRNEEPNKSNGPLSSHDEKTKTKGIDRRDERFDCSSDSLPDIEHILKANKKSCTMNAPKSCDSNSEQDLGEDEFEYPDPADCDWSACVGGLQAGPLQSEQTLDSSETNPHRSTIEVSSQHKRLTSPRIGSTEVATIFEAGATAQRSADDHIMQFDTQKIQNQQKTLCELGNDMDRRGTWTSLKKRHDELKTPNGLLSQYISFPLSILSDKDKYERKQKEKEHEEDQKRKWAQFEPWMYEQFGKHVDII